MSNSKRLPPASIGAGTGSAEPPTYVVRVTATDAGRDVRAVLHSRLQMSTRLTRQFPAGEHVFCNDRPIRLVDRVRAGDEIKVVLPVETSTIESMPMDLDIRYEDDEVLVLNKPAGMLTHPSAKERSGSLQSGVRAYLLRQCRVPHCVHRLDRDTSGVVLFAKHAHAHHLFDRALRRGQVHRVYTALAVTGPRTGRDVLNTWQQINLPIADNPEKPSRRVVDASGQRALTHFRVVAVAQEVSLLQLVLATGRTHQIRLHMQAVGSPLLGDADYGADDSGARGSRLPWMKRQALHAMQIGWRHLVSRELCVVAASPPADFRAAWRGAGGAPDALSQLVQNEEALHQVQVL